MAPRVMTSTTRCRSSWQNHGQMMDLFDDAGGTVVLAPGAMMLAGFARADDREVLAALAGVVGRSPFRYMVTPAGWRMSVAVTSCGRVGWVTDRKGYRYDPLDPDTGTAWPAMPPAFLDLAVRAAVAAGFGGFAPDTRVALLHGSCRWRRSQGQCRRSVPPLTSGCLPCLSS